MRLHDVIGESNSLLIQGDDIHRDIIFQRLNTLNMIHHYLQSSRKLLIKRLGKERYEDFLDVLDHSIHVAEMFHSFLVENKMALEEVKSNTKALVFGRLSDVTSMYEEYITKEDPIKDILMHLVPFFLSAVSEKSYITSARIGHMGILRSHALCLYSALYDYVKEYHVASTMEDMENVADMMEKLYMLLNSLAEDQKGVIFYLGMYLIVYNLRISELMKTVKSLSGKLKVEV